MDKVKLGGTDVEVSALCYGTDLIGSRVGEKQSHKLLDVFADNGGTFIDTGNFYASWYPGCVEERAKVRLGAGWRHEATALEWPSVPNSGSTIRAAKVG